MSFRYNGDDVKEADSRRRNVIIIIKNTADTANDSLKILSNI